MRTLLVSVFSGTVIAVLVIWMGIYNVSANDQHFSITSNILELVRERSIETRSDNLTVPELENIEMIKEGAEHYAQMCTECHLAPGMNTTELNSGLYPRPPVFSNQNYDAKPQKQFWVIKNGIKMTGMPSWYPAHSDEQIWAMVAFLQVANTLTENDYQELSKASGDGHEHGQHTNDKDAGSTMAGKAEDDGHEHSH